jgi:hypothetical protein
MTSGLGGRSVLVRGAVALGTVALALGACSDPPQPPPSPAVQAAFPADYAASYVEVRNCRKSGDHELDFVRVLTDPAATGPYRGRSAPFPEGAVVLKEQYDVSDSTCAGPIVSTTVMVKHAAAADRLGWDWQRVSPDRTVTESNASRCITCHAGCTGAPEVGYDYTCEEP